MSEFADKILRFGLDIGSTTVKLVVIDQDRRVLFKEYRRHKSDIRKSVIQLLEKAYQIFGDIPITIKAAGSAGISIAEWLKIPFVQEVIASSHAIRTFMPDTDVAIELGGEDAKITYFEDIVDQRMNGTCAGGTGAFIDQMAVLLKTDTDGLNELAASHTMIYPIASRCGVFAKTDIQPLLNEGAAREDIAASILQAVVNQTIGGLAQGKPIRGNVAFLGGPLSFMSELRQRFIETLQLTDGQVRFPDEMSRFFVALGAALESEKEQAAGFGALYDRLPSLLHASSFEVQRMRPLFYNQEELDTFRARHGQHRVNRRNLEGFSGPCFLGIDAGSTTTKAALIDTDGRLLYSFYDGNHGSPLKSTIRMLEDLYGRLPPEADIIATTVTGYGEALIRTALQIDIGEIETVAHYKAADYFLPGVDFILDIGGQDMKCLRIRDGVIDEILLNEACSSGCGSFIETFAFGLDMNAAEFAGEALLARGPVDLGSRCTVFMNSRVKQAQKEGVTIGDISAGLSYSVIKNALTKVIKIKNPEDLGEKIIVQGGTFYNEAVLKAFELISGREAVRPDIAGLMGAFGAALIARERTSLDRRSGLLKPDQLKGFSSTTRMDRCGRCGNNCLLTITTFSDGRTFVTGNRCERGAAAAGLEAAAPGLPNMYKFKYNRIFGYRPLKRAEACGTIGIPRVLNMFENYPFWFTFFTSLGYRVLLSAPSSKQLFENGMDSIPSESVCYPAKLVHGHIENLQKRNIDFIWYPSIPYERKEDPDAGNHYNCPIVSGYPEVIKANMSGLNEDGMPLRMPYLSMHHKFRLTVRLYQEFRREGFSFFRIARAVQKAWKEKQTVREEIQAEAERTLQRIRAGEFQGIILSGRPYHIDPEINHGIPDLINQMGMAVLSEDSVSHLARIERPLRVVDQWVYHNRLYSAAHLVARTKGMEMVQLTSFGCGLDAITSDQIHEILHRYGKIFTVIKIDEGNQLGAARIRLRSLKAVMDERSRSVGKAAARRADRRTEARSAARSGVRSAAALSAAGTAQTVLPPAHTHRVPFTREMKSRYTILAPQMSPIHFEIMEHAFRYSGYRFEVLPSVDHQAVDIGLKYVHNDACYPSILVVGQMIEALQSGSYDLDRVALLITQTGGGCRATNYIAFLRKALRDAGLGHIPIISLNAVGLEENPGFTIDEVLVRRAFQGMVYGDLLMRVLLATRPYEEVPGSAERLYRRWVDRCIRTLAKPSRRRYHHNIRSIIRDFDSLPLRDIRKPKVGLVGEILVKFHPTANNEVIKVIEREGAEAVMPDLFDFFLYTAHTGHFKFSHLSKSLRGKITASAVISYLETYRSVMRRALRRSRRFTAPPTIYEMARRTAPVVSMGAIMGEGWFLTGEMIELIEHGADNIICMQPFACLPNQITGKGMIKALKHRYPGANIAAIDYDPGASEVNQLNRIKLMLSVAFEKLEKKQAADRAGCSLGEAAGTAKETTPGSISTPAPSPGSYAGSSLTLEATPLRWSGREKISSADRN